MQFVHFIALYSKTHTSAEHIVISYTTAASVHLQNLHNIMVSKKVRPYNRSFPIFWAIIKILGLFPLAACTEKHNISRTALLFTLCNVGVLVSCHTLYFIHLSDVSSPEEISTNYRSPLSIILDQADNIISMVVLILIYLSLFIYKNQYGQLFEIFKNVDENLQQINYLALVKVSKKRQILSCGQVSGLFLVLFGQLIHTIKIYKSMHGKWPDIRLIIVYNFHFLYKLVALLHFWIVMYEVKKRYNSLKLILVNILQKSTF
jgi:hypothetical protein